jgi:hypothetical protein
MANLSCIPKSEKQAIVNRWVGQSLKLMLLDNAHVPNPGADQYVSDVVAREIIDVNDIYTAGGVALENLIASPDPLLPNNYFLDADDVSIGSGATITYRFGIIYEDMGTGNHAVNPIRAEIDFGSDQSVTNGISTIIWNTLGIIYIS